MCLNRRATQHMELKKTSFEPHEPSFIWNVCMNMQRAASHRAQCKAGIRHVARQTHKDDTTKMSSKPRWHWCTCAMVLSSRTVWPQAALISSHSTAVSAVRPRRKPPIVPKAPSCQIRKTSWYTLVCCSRFKWAALCSICSSAQP